jgi:hypothetical protein
MSITRSQLLAVGALGVAAALSLGLASHSQVATDAPANVRLVDVLASFSSGNVIYGPGVCIEENLIDHPKFLATSPTSMPEGCVTIANLGQTSVELQLGGIGILGIVLPGDTFTSVIPGSGTGPLAIQSTDIGGGTETRVVWVVRQVIF